jgi:beta-galactosidase
VATHELHTAGVQARVVLSADTPAIAADGKDVAHVEARIVDANDVPVPNTAIPLTARVTGAGVFAAMGSADPENHTCHRDTTHTTFNGQLQTVLRSLVGEAGEITLTVETPTLPPATLTILSDCVPV